MGDPVKRWLGIDSFGVLVHVVVTICMMAFVGMSNGPEELFPVLTGGSLLVLAARRSRALQKRADSGEITGEQPPAALRLADLEHRVAEIEAVQERVYELEERLDFSERLLAQGRAAEPADREANR
jgi:hypothetical protein